MHLYFVRHAESEANTQRIISNRGWRYPLTYLGRDQAHALGQRLQAEGITHLISSPVMRAVQTAEIISIRLGIPFTTTEALLENDNGSLDGRSDAQAWQIYTRAMDLWFQGVEDARIADGESLAELRARFRFFIHALVGEHRGTPNRIVLVGHGGLLRAGLPVVLEKIDSLFAWDHLLAHCGVVMAEERDGKLWCSAWDGAELDWRKG